MDDQSYSKSTEVARKFFSSSSHGNPRWLLGTLFGAFATIQYLCPLPQLYFPQLKVIRGDMEIRKSLQPFSSLNRLSPALFFPLPHLVFCFPCQNHLGWLLAWFKTSQIGQFGTVLKTGFNYCMYFLNGHH